MTRRAAIFLLANTLLSGYLNNVEAHNADTNVRDMGVSFECELRDLRANFSWSYNDDGVPDRLWLEVSLFKEQWNPDADTAQRIELEPAVRSATLPLETDTVYYWRLRSERDGGTFETDTKQIYTPNCVADFVSDD